MNNRIAAKNLAGSRRTIILNGIILLALTLLLSGQAMAGEEADDLHQMVQVERSNKSFPQTLESFKEEADKAGWSVLNVNNMAGVLSRRGYTLDPVVILDVCSGKYSAQILGNDDYRPISAFMPCRVSIYQTSEGEVFIARLTTGVFLEMMPPEVADVMSASDEEVARIIAETVR